MRLARLYIVFALAIVVACDRPSEEATGPDEEDEPTEEVTDESAQPADEDTTNEDPPENGQLPILPPIILLDFANDLDSSNSTGDEKSKRTVDSSLGYGFGRNNLFSGKYNYYFPAGKSGTAVSIEESISPFPPTTIIESVKPITETPYPDDVGNDYRNPPRQGGYRNGAVQTNRQPLQTSGDRFVGAQPVFGQRTKLYKPSQIDYGAYQGFSTTTRTNLGAQTTARPDYSTYPPFGAGPKSAAQSPTTSRPDYRPNGNTYTTPNPAVRSGSYTPGLFQGAQTTARPDYSTYPPFGAGPKSAAQFPTTSRPDYRPNGNTYTTPNPAVRSGSYTPGFFQGAQTSQRPYAGYSTPAPPAYVTPTASSQTRYTLNNANSYDGTTTPRTANDDSLGYKLGSPLSSFENLPRFTVENGVRYENKIVWKYPDGQISQTPPTSYVNSYSEFLSKENPRFPGSSGHRNAGAFQGSASGNVYRNSGGGPVYTNQGSVQTSFRDEGYQSGVRYQEPQGSRYPSESLGNIYSKSPAQFPKDQDLGKPRPSQFVSSASFLSGVDYGTASRAQEPQDHGYQGQFGRKNPQPGLSSGSSSGPVLGYDGLLAGNSKIVKDHYTPTNYGNRRPVLKYAINSPNPEYLPKPTESPSILTPSGTLSPQVLSKYSAQAQRYLTKVFDPMKSSTAPSSYPYQGTHAGTTAPQIDTSYENLLNYNPSISQYIKNPASILNAQPTYIQAGNSLIPVIILRVDGTPPIRTKTAPNINLKALLQQYLTQYAGNVARNTDYEIGNGDDYGNAPGQSAPQSPLQELAQLTQSLTRYSEDPSIADDLAKRFAGSLDRKLNRSNSYPRPLTNYGAIGKTGDSDAIGNYETTKIKPQKVKSVQIIEDPRFTSYKVNS